MSYDRLNPTWLEALLAEPRSFVVLERNAGRPATVGLLTVDEEEAVLVDRDSMVSLRPDKLPEGTQHSMLNLVPLFVGNANVGWLIYFPALPVTVGRNFVKVVRAKAVVGERKAPNLTVLLRNIVIMELPDTMTLVLATQTKDMRT